MADKDMRTVIRGVMMDNKVPQANNFAYAFPRFSKAYRDMIIKGSKRLVNAHTSMFFITCGVLFSSLAYRYLILGKLIPSIL